MIAHLVILNDIIITITEAHFHKTFHGNSQ